MKKILLISFEYPIDKHPIDNNYCGGVGHVVKQNRQVLCELGYEVYVLVSLKFQKKHSVKLLLPNDCFINYPSLYSFLKEYKWRMFDYIIQHFVNWTKELRKIKYQKGGRPKIIYHFHSILRREKDSGFNILNRFLLNQEKMIDIADRILCPSRYEYDNFIRYFPYFGDKVALIENTIESFSYQENEVKNIKKKYRIKKDDIISMYVGRFERIKGAHVLIKDISHLLRKHRNLKLFIFGKVLEREIYRRYKKVHEKFPRQIYFVKYVSQDILFQYYHISHIYINSSLSESFSLSTHESALCNNALLLNQLPVFDKFKDAALFYSDYDRNGLNFISQFERLITDKKLRKSISQKAVRIAKRYLGTDGLKKDFIRVLDF